ncbi:MAG TPA: redoxin domain-containing protein [Dehalococcoidia bacterium]|nr:redoxin domain-containing protein [Dehalococcoidia bacterium]
MAEGNKETRTLRVGDEAPDFTLKDHDRQEFKLSDHRGKKIVLNFFPAAFSGVCSQQMPRIEEQKQLFGDDTVVVGISVDGVSAQKAFKAAMDIDFPLLADFYPHGEVAEKYGVFLPVGVSERAVIGIDADGKIAYINVNPILEVPDLEPCAVALGG